MKLTDSRGERFTAILAAMEKQRQAAKRLDEATEHAAKVSYGLVLGGSVDAIAKAEAAVTAAHTIYRAASLELVQLLVDDNPLPAPSLNLTVA